LLNSLFEHPAAEEYPFPEEKALRGRMVCLVYLVYSVYLVSLVELEESLAGCSKCSSSKAEPTKAPEA
jgi:hypothetical protein